MTTFVHVTPRMFAHAKNDPPPSRWCTVRLTNGRSVRTFRLYKIDDYRTQRPTGHPEVIKRVHRSRAVLEKGQVWAEAGTGGMWTIADVTRYPNGGNLIVLNPYGCPALTRVITERNLRENFRIWDDAVNFRARFYARSSTESRISD